MFFALAGLCASKNVSAEPGVYSAKTAKLAKRLGVRDVPILNPEALRATLAKLEAARAGKGRVRVLHLGDSHVAADLITQTIRADFQASYGDLSRGFTVVNQRAKFGGRLLKDKGWAKDRIVDTGRAGRPYGFSGASLTSKKKGAQLRYSIAAEDREVQIFYQAQKGGAKLSVSLDGKALGDIDTGDGTESKVASFELPASKKKKRVLQLVANGKNARVYGMSFNGAGAGVQYAPIGPVGADAKVYLQLDEASFTQHLAAYAPDLIVLMVGGNDALKIRKKWTTFEKVEKDHRDLVALLKKALPKVEILIWSPMDAGKKVKGKVVSKDHLPEMTALQKRVAESTGCAFWDLHAAMGGDGSITRWSKARIMNADLVHPKGPAAELIGKMFTRAWFEMAK